MMNQKRISLILVILIITGLFFGCSEHKDTQSQVSPTPSLNNSGSKEGDISHFFTLEESLTQANDVLFATYVGPHINEINHVDYAFRINTRLKGQTETDIIYLSSGFYVEDSDAEASNSPFLKDEEYLLVLERLRVVYFSYDRYAPYAYMIIPLSDLSKSTINKVKAGEYSDFPFDETSTVSLLTAYIEEIIATEESQKVPPFYGAVFTDSEDLKEIIEISEYICHIRIIEGVNTHIPEPPTWVYKCEMVNPLFGSFSNDDLNISIYIAFFVGSTKPDEEYIVLLNKASETNTIYALSSRNSVRSVDEYEEITAILADLGKG